MEFLDTNSIAHELNLFHDQCMPEKNSSISQCACEWEFLTCLYYGKLKNQKDVCFVVQSPKEKDVWTCNLVL